MHGYDYGIQDVKDTSNQDLKTMPTCAIMAMLDTAEGWLLEHEGGFYYDEDKRLPKPSDSTGTMGSDPPAHEVTTVADRTYAMQDELARRSPLHRQLNDLEAWLGDHVDWAEGLQHAVDQLKNHRHAEKTGEPVRLF